MNLQQQFNKACQSNPYVSMEYKKHIQEGIDILKLLTN